MSECPNCRHYRQALGAMERRLLELQAQVEAALRVRPAPVIDLTTHEGYEFRWVEWSKEGGS